MIQRLLGDSVEPRLIDFMFTIISTAERAEKAEKNDQIMLKAVMETNEEILKNIRNHKNAEKNTIWHLAVENNVESTIDFLLQMGKGNDTVNSDGKSVLDLAVARRDAVLVRRLIHEAGFRKANLFYAARDTEIFSILVKEAKRNMYEINLEGQSLLHAACAYRNFDLVVTLLSAGLNVNLEDCFGQTPIHFAIRSKCSELVIFLHTNRAILNKPKRYFSSKSKFKPVLIEALKARDYESLSFLLKNGADPNATDEMGRNAVNYACQEGYPNTIILDLLRTGSDPSLVDKREDSALKHLESDLSALTIIYSLHSNLFSPLEMVLTTAESSCPICKDSIEDSIPKLPCEHKFHTECLQEWQKTSLACPLCSCMTVSINIPKRKTRMISLLKAINKPSP